MTMMKRIPGFAFLFFLIATADPIVFRVTAGAAVPLRERISLNPEAIAEVQIITNQYAAEYGRASGGRINLRTRGGANELRGEGYFYFGDEALNANTYFRNARGLGRVPQQQRREGGIFSGPIRRHWMKWRGRRIRCVGRGHIRRFESRSRSPLPHIARFQSKPRRRRLRRLRRRRLRRLRRRRLLRISRRRRRSRLKKMRHLKLRQ